MIYDTICSYDIDYCFCPLSNFLRLVSMIVERKQQSNNSKQISNAECKSQILKYAGPHAWMSFITMAEPKVHNNFLGSWIPISRFLRRNLKVTLTRNIPLKIGWGNLQFIPTVCRSRPTWVNSGPKASWLTDSADPRELAVDNCQSEGPWPLPWRPNSTHIPFFCSFFS